MNKNFYLIIVAVLVLLGVGYFMMNSKSQTTQELPTTEDEAMAPSKPAAMSEYTIALSEQNESGESGTATLTETDGKVKVMLNLTGTPAGVTQPAHIHVGSCPDVGAVKYPLESPVGGVSETVLDITLDQLRAELPLGLNVHKSAAEASVYVSCGDLSL